MSSVSSSDDSTDPVDWDDLSAARQRLLKTIGFVAGPVVIERPDFQDTVESVDEDDLKTVIDDKERVLKSLNSTHLLNELVTDGYLRKVFQGGQNPIVLDLEYDEDRDTHNVAPFGAAAQLQTMAFEVLDREDIPTSALDGVDMTDFNAVINAVNRAVGHTVLVIVSDPSEYRLSEEAVDTVMSKVEAM